MPWSKLYVGDALKVMKTLKSESIDMVMTSPPYWGLRDYRVKGQIGLEATPEQYIQRLVKYFHELKRILKLTGSFYLNMGDTYVKKNLQLIPARIALALQQDGWILRNDIIWYKPNHMPASVKDRLTNAHEHLFHFVKSRKYYYDLDSIRIPHKTASLERYQRGINQKAFGKPYEGKYTGREEQVNRRGGMQASAIRRGISVNPPKWFKETAKPERNYQGKFDGMEKEATEGSGSPHAHVGRQDWDIYGQDYHPLGKNPGDVVHTADGDFVVGSKEYAKWYFNRRKKQGWTPRGNLEKGHKKEGASKGLALVHPYGKNPADVVNNFALEHARIRGQSGEARVNLYESDRVKYHKAGKNPGDVVEVVVKDTYRHHGSDPSNLRHGEDILLHPSGKNPGDVMMPLWKQEVKRTGRPLKPPKGVSVSGGNMGLRKKARQDARLLPALENPPNRQGKQAQISELTPKEQFYRKHGGTRKPMSLIRDVRHPAGKNPGDVLLLKGHKGKELDQNLAGHAALEEYLYRCRAEGRTEGHPLGKNPGDVVQAAGDLASANTGINNKEPYQRNNPHQARLKYGHDAGHPEGKNPGDVIYAEQTLKFKGRKQIRQDQNLGGIVGLAEFRDACRANGMPESHPSGKNPGDVVDLSPETRSKEKLLRQRRRELDEMRREGKIHWELHPSKDPRWFGKQGKNPTDFWTITTKGFPGAHFAVYPEALCVKPILSSCPPKGVVLDPFLGSGTTMKVALEFGRNCIGIELNPNYVEIVRKRIRFEHPD